VRGVGEKAVENIIDERVRKGEFANIYDFCERIDTRAVQKSTVDALIRCGGFASMKAARSQLLNVLEGAFEAGQRQQDDKRSGQIALFGASDDASAASVATNVALPNIDEFEPAELLKMEKELLGFYITSHPLAQQQKWVDKYTTASTREAMNCSEGTEVTIGGMLSSVKTKVAKTGRSAGQRWAILEIEDLDGKIEGMLFAEGFASISAKFPDLLKAESICFVRGKIDRKRENPCLIVNDVIPVTEAISRLTTAVLIKFDPSQHSPETLSAVKPILGQFKGNTDVYAQLLDHESRKVTLKLSGEYKIRPGTDLIENLEQLLGNGNVDVVGEGLKRIRRLEQQKLFNEPPIEETKLASEDAVVAEMDAAME
jgi:DNA polymerase-3 subunit alpha